MIIRDLVDSFACANLSPYPNLVFAPGGSYPTGTEALPETPCRANVHNHNNATLARKRSTDETGGAVAVVGVGRFSFGELIHTEAFTRKLVW
jgi:hypothetical protein